jgi:hypothetical protein
VVSVCCHLSHQMRPIPASVNFPVCPQGKTFPSSVTASTKLYHVDIPRNFFPARLVSGCGFERFILTFRKATFFPSSLGVTSSPGHATKKRDTPKFFIQRNFFWFKPVQFPGNRGLLHPPLNSRARAFQQQQPKAGERRVERWRRQTSTRGSLERRVGRSWKVSITSSCLPLPSLSYCPLCLFPLPHYLFPLPSLP